MNQEIISFDKNLYLFDSMLLKYLRQHEGYESLDSLDNLHKFCEPLQAASVAKLCYDFFTTIEFRDVYYGLCCRINKEKFSGAALFQKIPSVRIAMPGIKSVNFHTDNWYGHGEDVCNYWMPLVDVSDSMSLAILSEEDSKAAIEGFRGKKVSISEINSTCQEKMRYLDMTFGEIYFFNSKTLHGTMLNVENRTRVSLDFRSRKPEQSAGQKADSFFTNPCAANFFTNPNEPGENENLAVIYVSSNNANKKFLSQKYQQLVCLRYAEELGLKVIAVETELVGFDYLINLHDLISGSRMGMYKNLIIFSKDQVNLNEVDNQSLLKSASDMSVKIHFVLEDELWD